MAALMAAATIWVSTVLTMSIFAPIWLRERYIIMLMVEPMFQKAAAIIAAIKQNLNPCFGSLQALQLQKYALFHIFEGGYWFLVAKYHFCRH